MTAEEQGDQPYDIVADLMARAAWCDHVLGTPVDSTVDSIVRQLPKAIREAAVHIERMEDERKRLLHERDRLRAALARHARFRAEAVVLLKAAENAFDGIAMLSGGEPQYAVQGLIRDFLDEIDTRLSLARPEAAP